MTTLIVTSGLIDDHETYFYLSKAHAFGLGISKTELDKRVPKYHWDDRDKLYKDYCYLKFFYENILLELSEKLNVIHDTSHSTRYWRIFIGPWLFYYLQIIFDRWEMVTHAVEQIEPELIILCPAINEAVYRPIGMSDFRKMYIDQAWNDNLFREIIIFKNKFSLQEISNNSLIPVNKSLVKIELISCIKKIKIHLKNFIIFLFASSKRPIITETGLSVLDEFKLNIALGFIQFPIPEINHIKNQHESTIRTELDLNSSSACEFEIFAKKMIVKNIPTNYLECYKDLCENILNLPWPKDPKFIFTSYGYNANDHLKLWAATKVDCGVPLIIGQHGGNLGTAKFTSSEDHEIAISDQYLTWGWSDCNRKCSPVGMLKKIRKQKTSITNKKDLLMVSSVFPRYSYVLGSYPTGENQVNKNLSDQNNFLCRLNLEVFDNVVMRLFRPDWSWNQFEYWRELHPNLRLNNGSGNIGKLLDRARLCVITYNATTFLEVLSQNIPTIAFWDSNYWELREDAVQLFDALKEVGVLWENPSDAANQVNKIWGNVENWWQQTAIQEARLEFCSKYAVRADNIVSECKSALLAAKSLTL